MVRARVYSGAVVETQLVGGEGRKMLRLTVTNEYGKVVYVLMNRVQARELAASLESFAEKLDKQSEARELRASRKGEAW